MRHKLFEKIIEDLKAEPHTVDDLELKYMGEISRRSIYRILEQIEEAGIGIRKKSIKKNAPYIIST
tara:strand:+ start:186 stop:383 length:198 start_codon:yes stop_codon:yes gene_type:complete